MLRVKLVGCGQQKFRVCCGFNIGYGLSNCVSWLLRRIAKKLPAALFRAKLFVECLRGSIVARRYPLQAAGTAFDGEFGAVFNQFTGYAFIAMRWQCV